MKAERKLTHEEKIEKCSKKLVERFFDETIDLNDAKSLDHAVPSKIKDEFLKYVMHVYSMSPKYIKDLENLWDLMKPLNLCSEKNLQSLMQLSPLSIKKLLGYLKLEATKVNIATDDPNTIITVEGYTDDLGEIYNSQQICFERLLAETCSIDALIQSQKMQFLLACNDKTAKNLSSIGVFAHNSNADVKNLSRLIFEFSDEPDAEVKDNNNAKQSDNTSASETPQFN